MAARTNRGAREANNADLGERGRRTGIAMPKEGDIPLTQDGYEDMDAYFKSPESAAHASARKKQVNNKIGGFTPGRGSQSQSQIPSSAGRRARSARPDVAHELGVRGRKTGMPIVNNNRMPLTADGMEQMDPFFAQGPPSIPPVARAGHRRGSKAIQAVVDDLQADSDGDEEEAGRDQTANYGRHAGTWRTAARPSTSTSIAEDEDEDEEEEEEEEDAQEEDQEEASQNSQSEEDEDREAGEGSEAPTPKASTSKRRKSYASTSANTSYQDTSLNGQDESEEEDDEEIDAGGTQTMDLETSSYFNKSTRSLGNLAASSSRRRHSDHTEDYDTVPSPSQLGSSGSGRTKNARNASSARGQRVQALQSDASSDDEAIEQSLTGQSSASRRQSTSGQRRRSLQSYASPRDRKGKQVMGKRSEVAARGAEDASSEDETGEASGWQPADNDATGIREFDDAGMDGDGPDGMEDEEEDGELQGDGNGVSEDDEEDQDEQEGGLEPIREEDEDDERAEEEPTPKANKGKKRMMEPDDSGHGEAVQKAAPQRKRKKNTPEDPSGLRRSSRDRTAPVEYWRNERVIYRRRDSGVNCYYEKIGVESKPRGPTRSLSKRPGARSASASSQQRKKPTGNGRLRSLSASSAEEHDMQRPDMSEWDRETDPDGIVWDYVEGKEHRRRIAWTKAMLDPKPTKHQGYQFQRIFTDGVFMAGGWLVIPPGCNKPLKPARDNTYMLFCAQGAVRVLLHRTEFTIAEGGFFLIPRGNSYQINNLTDIDAKLAFMQSREISAVVDDGDAAAPQEA